MKTRISVIYLSLALLACCLMALLPVVSFVTINTAGSLPVKEWHRVFVPWKIINNQQITYYPWLLLGLLSTIITTSLAIFSGKRASRQLFYIQLGIGLLLVLFVLCLLQTKSLHTNGVQHWEIQNGVYLFSIGLITFILAGKSTRKAQRKAQITE